MRQDNRSVNLLLAVGLFILYVSINVATLHRYGVSLDEPEHWVFGDRYLQFYLTFDPRALDFSSVDWSPTQTWPVGPTLAAFTTKIFSERLNLVDQNEGHHLASVFLFGLLLSGMYLFLAAHAGRTAALLSCLALALHPRIWGDAHNNSEDIPHLVFYALSILTLIHGMMTQRAGWLLVSGICWGLALGSKMNALLLPVVFAPMLLPMLWDQSRQPASIKRSLAAYPIIAFSVFFLAWPYLWQHPLERLAHFWSFVLRWGYGGRMAWQSSPAMNVLITTPLPTLALALIGIITSVWTGRPLGRRANLTLLCWLLLPITRSSLPGVLNYDVIRRFMEFTPALAIFAGIGGAALIDWTTRSGLFTTRRLTWVIRMTVVAALLSPATQVLRYFPYENTYYNRLVGGLGGAQSLKLEGSTDYHASSYREGVNWLNAHADRGSLLIASLPHLIQYYPLRKDIVPTKHVWMDELPARGRAVYLMYVTTEAYDYNICFAEAFLRPEYEIRRDGGTLLRIYKLSIESHLAVTRNAFPSPQQFSVTRERSWVTLSWQATPARDVVGHIFYFGRAPGQYDGSVCFRQTASPVELLALVRSGTYYLSLSVLTRQAQESQRTPEIRKEVSDTIISSP